MVFCYFFIWYNTYVNAANGWTQISTNTVTINNAAPLNAQVGTLNTLFSGLSFMIPANTTYRFWLGVVLDWSIQD
ncbi:MAG: hypothetical protein HWD58_00335 [Bacteroidota bacterium]|nr:MAG: hypothetical protein HWD58_00335 [Bacteroidota bacterium]